MLVVSIVDKAPVTMLLLEGKLVGPWVNELEGSWEGLPAAPFGAVQVHLEVVTFIDAEGRELPTRMRRRGVRLVPAGCHVTAIVEEIDAQVAREHSH